jgi:ferrochelatase
MPKMPQDAEFAHDYTARSGVLLLNLGTPDAPTPAALRTYLKQFLSDRRVIEIPRLIWWPLLNGVILNTRPRQSARKYAQIWKDGASPLLTHTQEQTLALGALLQQRGYEALMVEFAMRYGQPSVGDALERMRRQHVERLLVVPLYPQYAAASTASALDAVFQTLMRQRNLPELRTLRNFHDHPAYIDALAQQIRAHWQSQGKPDILLMSFHGLPRYTLERGDPYHCECLKTGRLLAEALALAPHEYRISFQSRFGRTEWLKPYTAETLAELGRAGTRTLDVVCPGFVSDCLETLEEIAIEGAATFKQHGGGIYRYISCLNNNKDWITALADIIEPHLTGWVLKNQQDSALRQQRALATGATR